MNSEQVVGVVTAKEQHQIKQVQHQIKQVQHLNDNRAATLARLQGALPVAGEPYDTEADKVAVEKLTWLEMCIIYRFVELHRYLTVPVLRELFMKRFRAFGGMTPKMSRLIGPRNVEEFDHE